MAEEKRIQEGHSTRTSGDTVAAPALATSAPKEPDEFRPIKTDFGFLPIPKRLRYDPKRPAHFGLLLNATFGIASTFGTSYGTRRSVAHLTSAKQSSQTYITVNLYSSSTQDRLA